MDEELILEQYRQCYENLRHRYALLWQLPSIEALLVSAIIVAAYRYLNGLPRKLVLLVGVLIAICLSLAVFRHRYFSIIEEGTLSKMESKLGLPLIQRVITKEKQLEQIKESDKKKPMFWYVISPENFGRWFGKFPNQLGKLFKKLFEMPSAHWWLITCSLFIFLVIFFLFLCEAFPWLAKWVPDANFLGFFSL